LRRILSVAEAKCDREIGFSIDRRGDDVDQALLEEVPEFMRVEAVAKWRRSWVHGKGCRVSVKCRFCQEGAAGAQAEENRVEQEVGAFWEPGGGEPAGFGEFAVEVAGMG
jgi:hypothetical protein